MVIFHYSIAIDEKFGGKFSAKCASTPEKFENPRERFTLHPSFSGTEHRVSEGSNHS
jgi:hypothetical protein